MSVHVMTEPFSLVKACPCPSKEDQNIHPRLLELGSGEVSRQLTRDYCNESNDKQE